MLYEVITPMGRPFAVSDETQFATHNLYIFMEISTFQGERGNTLPHAYNRENRELNFSSIQTKT